MLAGLSFLHTRVFIEFWLERLTPTYLQTNFQWRVDCIKISSAKLNGLILNCSPIWIAHYQVTLYQIGWLIIEWLTAHWMLGRKRGVYLMPASCRRDWWSVAKCEPFNSELFNLVSHSTVSHGIWWAIQQWAIKSDEPFKNELLNLVSHSRVSLSI